MSRYHSSTTCYHKPAGHGRRGLFEASFQSVTGPFHRSLTGIQPFSAAQVVQTRCRLGAFTPFTYGIGKMAPVPSTKNASHLRIRCARPDRARRHASASRRSGSVCVPDCSLGYPHGGRRKESPMPKAGYCAQCGIQRVDRRGRLLSCNGHEASRSANIYEVEKPQKDGFAQAADDVEQVATQTGEAMKEAWDSASPAAKEAADAAGRCGHEGSCRRRRTLARSCGPTARSRARATWTSWMTRWRAGMGTPGTCRARGRRRTL